MSSPTPYVSPSRYLVRDPAAAHTITVRRQQQLDSLAAHANERFPGHSLEAVTVGTKAFVSTPAGTLIGYDSAQHIWYAYLLEPAPGIDSKSTQISSLEDADNWAAANQAVT